MGAFRRWLAGKVAGARGSTVITIGSHIDTNSNATVAFSASENWKRINFRLTSDGARRIASQMMEWADAADKRNAENAKNRINLQWRYVTDALIAKADDKTESVEQTT